MTTLSHTVCFDHQRNPEKGYCATCERMKVERKIALMCAKAIVQKGYEIMVNDGCEDVTPYTGDLNLIEAAMFSTDEDYFLTRKRGEKNSFVRFIYGNNGPDVINDYGVSLEPIMSKVNAFADRQKSHNG